MSFANGHALLIGVGSYAHHPAMDVAITADDARAVAGVLADTTYCGYPQSQVTPLTGGAATRDGVLDALKAFAGKLGADDTLLLFYAGHGAYGDDGSYYLTTHDTQMQNRRVVSGTGVREAELIDVLRDVKAKRLLVFVNACHSGELTPVLAPDEEPLTGTVLPSQAAAALLGTGEGRVIITACRDGQYAFVGPGPLTLFTQALVDGLHGKGLSGKGGYISVFDLYTHLYFALEEAVPKQVAAVHRKKYGERQEPELTVLKGVGPFAVSLYRGATTLGAFDQGAAPPEGIAVRQVSPAYSKAMLQQLAPRQHQQTIGAEARVGAAIAGDVLGPMSVTQSSDTVDTGGGDNIKVGDVTGSSGIAIGRGARSTVRNVNTGGGDYAERNVDKRKGNFVSGDQFNMSGNFSGAILNIKSTLESVTQSISAAPHGDEATKTQLQELIAQLSTALQQVPADQAADAEAVAETAKAAVEHATKEKPNKTMIQISADGLKQAAQNLAAVLPTVLPIATKIAETIQRMVS
jgi:hypothetical protein